jgi:GntP family gluconate:H+ symporter
LLPVLLPVALITFGTFVSTRGLSNAIITLLCEKNIALVIGALVSIGLLWKQTSREDTVEALKRAIRSAGVIILITGAGGALGRILQQTNIAEYLESGIAGAEAAVLPLAFLLTLLIRTAQGSATVSMITAAGAFAGLASVATLGFHPVYLALAIGCGSKPIWWMNDSGFWVVTQMSGMPEKDALKTLTPMSCIMGIVGLIVVMLGAWLWPMA